jgi:hypothetical protein
MRPWVASSLILVLPCPSPGTKRQWHMIPWHTWSFLLGLWVKTGEPWEWIIDTKHNQSIVQAWLRLFFLLNSLWSLAISPNLWAYKLISLEDPSNEGNYQSNINVTGFQANLSISNIPHDSPRTSNICWASLHAAIWKPCASPGNAGEDTHNLPIRA